MKTLELVKKLQDYPLFTPNDIAKIINKKGDYVKTLIYRLEKKGMIYKIERGKYTLYDDVFVFCSHIYVPSYISLWTAIKYYNFTEQMPKIISVMTSKSRKKISFQNIQIEFIKTKHFFGFKKENYRGFEIFMAEPEKAVLDSLLSKKVPLDEIIKAIKTKRLNTERLIKYAIKIKNKNLIKRLGFILDENNLQYNKLIKLVNNNYTILDCALKEGGKLNKKWRIIDNRK